jgi:tripartite-type tricarboxylate transporter receptor subunit TctC
MVKEDMVKIGFKISFMAGVAALIMLPVAGASAQQYPNKVVRVIIPFEAGGGTDIVMRPLAAALQAKWRQTIIIENKTGAGGVIGAHNVATSEPDGYTMLATVNQTIVSSRFLYKNLPYNPDTSFVPISLVARVVQMVVARPDVPANDLKEFVPLVQKSKGQYSYGSYGDGSPPQLIFEMLNKRAGLDLVHAPFKGLSSTVAALLRGEVQVSVFSSMGAAQPIAEGKLKALALAGNERDPRYPNVPTTTELGFPELQAAMWVGVFGPAKMPADIVAKIAADIDDIVNSPTDTRANLIKVGWTPVGGKPQVLADAVRDETKIIGDMVAAAGLKPQ